MKFEDGRSSIFRTKDTSITKNSKVYVDGEHYGKIGVVIEANVVENVYEHQLNDVTQVLTYANKVRLKKIPVYYSRYQIENNLVTISGMKISEAVYLRKRPFIFEEYVIEVCTLDQKHIGFITTKNETNMNCFKKLKKDEVLDATITYIGFEHFDLELNVYDIPHKLELFNFENDLYYHPNIMDINVADLLIHDLSYISLLHINFRISSNIHNCDYLFTDVFKIGNEFTIKGEVKYWELEQSNLSDYCASVNKFSPLVVKTEYNKYFGDVKQEQFVNDQFHNQMNKLIYEYHKDRMIDYKLILSDIVPNERFMKYDYIFDLILFESSEQQRVVLMERDGIYSLSFNDKHI